MYVKYILIISKSQLNNEVNSKVNFQKMHIPLLVLHQILSVRHTNPRLAILHEGVLHFLLFVSLVKLVGRLYSTSYLLFFFYIVTVLFHLVATGSAHLDTVKI